jgi:hypothetical protein
MLENGERNLNVQACQLRCPLLHVLKVTSFLTSSPAQFVDGVVSYFNQSCRLALDGILKPMLRGAYYGYRALATTALP